MKNEIIPAILPMQFSELEEHLELIKGFAKTVQIDVCDGQFTPSASWPYRKHDENFDAIAKEERGMPEWESFNFEIDLMANRPEERVDEWVSAGATRIIVHAESRGNVKGAIENLKGRAEVGLALNIETNIEVIKEYKDDIQFVQCMGIDQIGFQGQKFDLQVIEQIKAIRATYPEMIISVDGGVSLENARDLLEAGANRLVVGSAIFESDNAIDAIQNFKAVVGRKSNSL